MLLPTILCLQPAAVLAREGIQAAQAREIQAAFLIKFHAYVRWPGPAFTKPRTPLVIGVSGRDPFGSILDRIGGAYASSPGSLEIRRLKDIRSLLRCHILYIPPVEMGHMDAIRNVLSGKPILLVGHAPGFLNQGGMINFVQIADKIRFDISLRNCRRVGLGISAKLLAVAHQIIQ